jgi:hypothetical protein
MNTKINTKLFITLLLMCLISTYSYAQEKMDLTSKGMMVEQGKAMMDHARVMIESGKTLMGEGDNMMKAGMNMMEGKISDKGSWALELNLEKRGGAN